MKIRSSRNSLSGAITVPGSKSHTIRALILATFADGVSHIKNPLPSADCLSAARAVPLLGSSVDMHFDKNGEPGTEWTVNGAGKNLHLPDDVIDVGNSGSLLYFLSPVASVFDGWSVFTGDESIRSRPVSHVVDALRQLGAEAYISRPGADGCPLLIKGPVESYTVTTPGEVSSQYISGLMMAAILMKEKLTINLTSPKETPYLVMTKSWLDRMGVSSYVAEDFSRIEVNGPVDLKAFDAVVPGDWEAVAFPLVAAIISNSSIVIEDIDGSGTQGDDAIVDTLKAVGADIEWDKEKCILKCNGGTKAKNGIGRLNTEGFADGVYHISMSQFPDAVCAIAVAACYTEGTVILEDAAVCRRKETDRLKVLATELTKLGADIEEGTDYLIIKGHSPVTADGNSNPEFKLHGGSVESYKDHRMAMALSCFGLGLRNGESVIVNEAESCSVSFPHFFEAMNAIGAGFTEAE